MKALDCVLLLAALTACPLVFAEDSDGEFNLQRNLPADVRAEAQEELAQVGKLPELMRGVRETSRRNLVAYGVFPIPQDSNYPDPESLALEFAALDAEIAFVRYFTTSNYRQERRANKGFSSGLEAESSQYQSVNAQLKPKFRYAGYYIPPGRKRIYVALYLPRGDIREVRRSAGQVSGGGSVWVDPDLEAEVFPRVSN